MEVITQKRTSLILFKIIAAAVLLLAIIPIITIHYVFRTTLPLDSYIAPNGTKYEFALDTNGLGVIMNKVLTNKYEYKYLNIDEYTVTLSRKREKFGVVKISFHRSDYGMYCFIDSDADLDLSFTIRADTPETPVIRYVNGGDIVKPAFDGVIGFKSDEQVYIEGGVFVKLGQISRIRDLGNTVFSVDNPVRGAEIRLDEIRLIMRVPLPHYKNRRTVSSFAICGAPLVKWEEPYVAQKIINLDSKKLNLIMEDGVYEEKPALYEPLDEKKDMVYKSVAAYHLKSSAEPCVGEYFRILASTLLYSHINSFDKAGYIPTGPRVSWLYDNYGFEHKLFDTRFNCDTIDALIYASKQFPDPIIGDTVKKALDYYIDFAGKNRFSINGNYFVPDYGHATGEKSASHCSLNHYLAEAVTLIKGGIFLNDFKYCDYGYDILKQIDKSADGWIRENNDLWYAINQNGGFERDDYIDVTYFDLKKARAFLTRLALWDNYPGIAKLLASKEAWLKADGREDITGVKLYID